MKKSILTLVAVLAAGLSQAASLNWTIANIKTPADSSVAGSDYTVMLFLTAQASSKEGFENFGKANTTLDKVTELADAGDFSSLESLAAAKASSTETGGVPAATGYNGNNFGSGDSLSGFAIIIDADQKNYFTTGIKSASWTSGTGAKALAFGSQANATYKSFGTSQPDIPEPATGALALAGVALLFRRRR